MVTVTKKERERILANGSIALVELAALSSDDKPTEMGETKIDNGSILIEVDTGKPFIYDLENEEWNEI